MKSTLIVLVLLSSGVKTQSVSIPPHTQYPDPASRVDGVPNTLQSLSLSDAVKTALQSSPKLRAARFDSQAMQAQTDRDRPVARPTVTAQAQGTLQGPRVTFPRVGDGDATVLPERFGRIELDLDQTLYRPGLGAARTRYGAQTQANIWDYRRTENDVIQETRRAYFQLLGAQTMAAVAHEGVELARKQRDLTKTMLEAGTASDRDLKAADADVAEAEQSVSKADNGVDLARANLNLAMGREPSLPLAITPAPPQPVVPEGPEAGIAQALQKRPEIRQIEENLRAAQAGVSLARTQNKPSLSARATAARETPSAFTAPDYFAASLVLRWNLFDAGRAKIDVREAQARVGQLEASLEETKLGIRLEVEKAWRDMSEAQSRIGTSERQVTAAEVAWQVSELRYQQRAAIQLEVSGALFKVIQARANKAQATFDLQVASADYAHATGADVEETTDLTPQNDARRTSLSDIAKKRP